MKMVIDLIFVSDILAKDLQWHVSENCIRSDHQAIILSSLVRKLTQTAGVKP